MARVILIIVAVIILELVALAWLFFTVGNYKNFWANKSQESGEITYLALGDSAAQGIGATSPMRGYVGIIAKRLDDKIITAFVCRRILGTCLCRSVIFILNINASY